LKVRSSYMMMPKLYTSLAVLSSYAFSSWDTHRKQQQQQQQQQHT
jgi:hypothetical protein